MRTITVTIPILMFAGWLTWQIELPVACSQDAHRSVQADAGANQWRRTADGWERRGQWQRTLAAHSRHRPLAANIHPAWVALFQLLVSLLALLLMAPQRIHRHRGYAADRQRRTSSDTSD